MLSQLRFNAEALAGHVEKLQAFYNAPPKPLFCDSTPTEKPAALFNFVTGAQISGQGAAVNPFSRPTPPVSFAFRTAARDPLPHDKKVKIILVGDGAVGKTAWVKLLQATGDHGNEAYKQAMSKYMPTIGVEICPLLLETTTGRKIEVAIWDCAGQEKFGGLRDGIGGNAAVIMFDATSRITYKSVPNWYRDIVRVCEDIPLILVRTKLDVLPAQIQIKARAITFHRKKSISFYDISSPDNYNLFEPLEHLFRKLYNEPGLTLANKPTPKRIPSEKPPVSGNLEDEDEDEDEAEVGLNKPVLTSGFSFGAPASQTDALSFSLAKDPPVSTAGFSFSAPSTKATPPAEASVTEPATSGEKPKRGPTAYVLFVKDHQAKVREANPGMTFGDVTKEVANMWKALSPQDKQVWQDKANAAK